MKKLLVMAVLVLSLAVLFTSCGREDDRETIILGMASGFPPFNILADEGEGVFGRYSGVSVSLVAAIAEELNLNVVVRDQEFGGLLPSLIAGEIDVIAAGMTIRPDRAEQVNFSVPYFGARQTVVVLADNDVIHTVADLDGMRIGVQLATTGEIRMTDENVELDLDVVSFTIPATGILELLAGSIDAFVIDSPVAAGFLALHPEDLRIFTDTDFFGHEQFGMAFNKENVDLLNRFNSVLERLIAEGFVDYLYAHYRAMLGLD